MADNKPNPNWHRVFANTNEAFQKACSDAGISPSKRQASRFRRKQGRAYKTHKGIAVDTPYVSHLTNNK